MPDISFPCVPPKIATRLASCKQEILVRELIVRASRTCAVHERRERKVSTQLLFPLVAVRCDCCLYNGYLKGKPKPQAQVRPCVIYVKRGFQHIRMFQHIRKLAYRAIRMPLP